MKIAVPIDLLFDLLAHLETHVGRRKPYDRKVSLLIDRVRMAIRCEHAS
jgi:hypothetical protein